MVADESCQRTLRYGNPKATTLAASGYKRRKVYGALCIETTLLCVLFVFCCQPLLSLSPSTPRSPAPALWCSVDKEELKTKRKSDSFRARLWTYSNIGDDSKRKKGLRGVNDNEWMARYVAKFECYSSTDWISYFHIIVWLKSLGSFKIFQSRISMDPY